jgi:hypothetical protein
MKKVQHKMAAIDAYRKTSTTSDRAPSVAPANSGVTQKTSEQILAKLHKSTFRVAQKIR